MIEFKYLKAEHTFAYELLEFDFKSGIYSIEGANGASKSSIYLAMVQGLYNRNPKGGKIDSVSNTVTGKPSVITVEWVNGGTSYQVINSRKAGISVSMCPCGDGNWQNIGKKRIPDNLKLIEELLGIPYDTFCMLTFQDVSSSLALVEDATDSARKNFTNKVLQFGELDRYLVCMKDAAKSLKKDVASLKAQCDTLAGNVLSLKPEVDRKDIDCIAKVLEECSQDRALLYVTRDATRAHQAKIKATKDSIDKWDTTGKRIATIVSDLADFRSTYASKSQADQEWDDNEEARRQNSDDLIAVNKDIRALVRPSSPKAPESTCSRCGQSLNNDEAMAVYDADVAKYDAELADYTDKHTKLHTARDEMYVSDLAIDATSDQLITELTKWEERALLESELATLRSIPAPDLSAIEVVGELSALSVKEDELTDKIDELDTAVREARQGIKSAEAHNVLQDSIRKFNVETAQHNKEVKSKVATKRTEIHALEAKLDHVNEAVNILGPKGYRVHKMMGFLSQLNKAMVKYSAMLSGGTIQCVFYVTEEGKIDFNVTDADKSLEFASWSSGEKARVKLSCLFAVLEILETVGSASYNVLFLDEMFSTLDDAGKEGLFKVLAYLRDKGKCVYTIAHSALASSGAFDRVIKATKVNGISTVA